MRAPAAAPRRHRAQCIQCTDLQNFFQPQKNKKTHGKQPNANPVAIPSDFKILQGAVVSGLSNGLINGAIQWFLLRGETAIPVSVDGITNDQQTVLGMAVPLAVSLAMVLTIIAYVTLRAPKRRFLPSGLWLTVKHGVFAFGLIVAAAVVWKRSMGTVTVSLATAVTVLAVVSGVVGAVVNDMTLHASLLRQP